MASKPLKKLLPSGSCAISRSSTSGRGCEWSRHGEARVAHEEVEEADTAAPGIDPSRHEERRTRAGADRRRQPLDRSAQFVRQERVLRLGAVQEMRRWRQATLVRRGEQVAVAPGAELGVRIVVRRGAVPDVVFGRRTRDAGLVGAVPARGEEAGLSEAPRLETERPSAAGALGFGKAGPVVRSPDDLLQRPDQRMAGEGAEPRARRPEQDPVGLPTRSCFALSCNRARFRGLCHATLLRIVDHRASAGPIDPLSVGRARKPTPTGASSDGCVKRRRSACGPGS